MSLSEGGEAKPNSRSSFDRDENEDEEALECVTEEAKGNDEEDDPLLVDSFEAKCSLRQKDEGKRREQHFHYSDENTFAVPMAQGYDQVGVVKRE